MGDCRQKKAGMSEAQQMAKRLLQQTEFMLSPEQKHGLPRPQRGGLARMETPERDMRAADFRIRQQAELRSLLHREANEARAAMARKEREREQRRIRQLEERQEERMMLQRGWRPPELPEGYEYNPPPKPETPPRRRTEQVARFPMERDGDLNQYNVFYAAKQAYPKPQADKRNTSSSVIMLTEDDLPEDCSFQIDNTSFRPPVDAWDESSALEMLEDDEDQSSVHTRYDLDEGPAASTPQREMSFYDSRYLSDESPIPMDSSQTSAYCGTPVSSRPRSRLSRFRCQDSLADTSQPYLASPPRQDYLADTSQPFLASPAHQDWLADTSQPFLASPAHQDWLADTSQPCFSSP